MEKDTLKTKMVMIMKYSQYSKEEDGDSNIQVNKELMTNKMKKMEATILMTTKKLIRMKKPRLSDNT
jgi:hypothetical protein